MAINHVLTTKDLGDAELEVLRHLTDKFGEIKQHNIPVINPEDVPDDVDTDKDRNDALDAYIEAAVRAALGDEVNQDDLTAIVVGDEGRDSLIVGWFFDERVWTVASRIGRSGHVLTNVLDPSLIIG